MLTLVVILGDLVDALGETPEFIQAILALSFLVEFFSFHYYLILNFH